MCRIIPVLFVIVSFSISCSSERSTKDIYNDVDIEKIVINPNSRQSGKLTLSDIVDSIEYIPLETKDECLIGIVTNFIYSEKYILIFCIISDCFYLFNRDGLFITQIGRSGGGPGEYYPNTARAVHVDEENNQVIIHTSYPQRFMFYDLNGQFLKSIPFEHYIGRVRYYDNYYLAKQANEGNTPFTYTILNNDFEIVHQQIKPVSFMMRPRGSQVFKSALFCEYIFDNQVHVRECMLNDTVYIVNDDFSIMPKYIINAGKYDITVELRSDADRFIKESVNNFSLTSLFETKDHLLISYNHQYNNSFCYYQKNDKKLLFFNTSGIPNDFDGGFDFWPTYQFNNQMITFYDAFLFEEHKKNTNKLKSKGPPEVINRFEYLSKELRPDDNPVIVIVTLK